MKLNACPLTYRYRQIDASAWTAQFWKRIVFENWPIGIVSNSPGPLGGVSAAKTLQNILPGISGPILGQPEIYLNAVGDAFDDKGQLTKEALQKVLQQYIDAYAAFVEKQNG